MDSQFQFQLGETSQLSQQQQFDLAFMFNQYSNESNGNYQNEQQQQQKQSSVGLLASPANCYNDASRCGGSISLPPSIGQQQMTDSDGRCSSTAVGNCFQYSASNPASVNAQHHFHQRQQQQTANLLH